jgi:sulfur carrier protein
LRCFWGSRDDKFCASGFDGSPVTLIVNGEPREISAASLAQVLGALDYGEAKVATALNGEFVPARARAATPVKEGDRIEILAPRQGG